jgi:hypothetical protein
MPDDKYLQLLENKEFTVENKHVLEKTQAIVTPLGYEQKPATEQLQSTILQRGLYVRK